MATVGDRLGRQYGNLHPGDPIPKLPPAAQIFGQLPHEPDAIYGIRSVLNQGLTGAGNVGIDLFNAISGGMDNPANREARAATAPHPAAVQANPFSGGIEGLTEGLIARGIPGHIARGVAAGLMAESAGNPMAVNPTSGAFGLSQWLGSRKQALQAQYGANPNPQQQLDYLVSELKGGDPGGSVVMSARTPQEALQAFVHSFARPGAAGEVGDMSRGYKAMGYGQAQGQNGFAAPFVNPFDPGYAQQAMGQIDHAAALEKQPFSMSTDVGPMPQPPQPDATPKTDFTQTDADLQAMKPTPTTLQEQHDIKWKNFWAGIGKSMSSMPEGAGVGDFFLRLGGGALTGKAAGMEELQQKKEDYDNKMEKWQQALYTNDAVKAQTHQNELMHDWSANQSWLNTKYQQNLALWTSNAKPTLVGNNVIFNKVTPEGKVQVTGVPIAQMVDADAAMKKAALMMNMFQEQNTGNSQVTSMENAFQFQQAGMQAAMTLSANSGASEHEQAAAAAFVPVQAAGFAISSGQLDGVLGPDEAKKLTVDVQKTLVAQGIYPGSQDYGSAFQNMAQQRLATAALLNPQTLQKLMTLSPMANLFTNYAQAQKSKETTQTTVDGRGRMSTRQSTTSQGILDPTSVFGGAP